MSYPLMIAVGFFAFLITIFVYSLIQASIAVKRLTKERLMNLDAFIDDTVNEVLAAVRNEGPDATREKLANMSLIAKGVLRVMVSEQIAVEKEATRIKELRQLREILP